MAADPSDVRLDPIVAENGYGPSTPAREVHNPLNDFAHENTPSSERRLLRNNVDSAAYAPEARMPSISMDDPDDMDEALREPRIFHEEQELTCLEAIKNTFTNSGPGLLEFLRHQSLPVLIGSAVVVLGLLAVIGVVVGLALQEEEGENIMYIGPSFEDFVEYSEIPFEEFPAGVKLQAYQPAWMEGKDMLCVTGQAANYYYSPSPGSTVWYIYLSTDRRESARDWCFNRDTCCLRNYYEPGVQIGPYLSDDFILAGLHLLFRNANVIYIPYCFSDAFMGREDAQWRNYHSNLQGLNSVWEVIRTAGIQANSTIFLAGSGAGSRAAMLLLDQLEPILPTGCEVRGIFDSSAWLDQKLFADGNFVRDSPLNLEVINEDDIQNEDDVPDDIADENFAFRDQAKLGLEFYKPPLPVACKVKYPGAEAWKCLMPEYLLPTLVNDYYLINPEFDFGQLNNNFGYAEYPRMPVTKDRLVYALNLRRRIARFNDKLVEEYGRTVYSPACPMFNLFMSDEIIYMRAGANKTTKEGGWFIREHLWSWVTRNVTQPLVRDDCVGFGCGPTCPW